MTAPDVLIIGSGPAGINAAWPLVLAGVSVMMVDADDRSIPASPKGSIDELRRDPLGWRHFLGEGLNGLYANMDLSPKFATPLGMAVANASRGLYELEALNLMTARTGVAGGLSSIWGAFCSAYDTNDLSDYPVTIDEIQGAYSAVAKRIGISGSNDHLGSFHGSDYLLQKPVPLTKPADYIYNKYMDSKPLSDFSLGLARNAVITENKDGRDACNQCGLCLYGCHKGSIYNSAYELLTLNNYSNFSYAHGMTVKRFISLGNGEQVVEMNGHPPISAKNLIVAAGTINSTAMVLEYAGMYGVKLPLLSNPVAAMGFVVPKFIGADFDDKTFSLGQLSYKLNLQNSNDYAMGVVYGGDALPLNSFARHMPFSKPTSIKLSAALAPSLLLATTYLPGRYSSNSMMLNSFKKNGLDNPKILVEGFLKTEAVSVLKYASKKLSKNMMHYGAYLIPSSLKIAAPGADAHVAGTIPMGGSGELSCSSTCELNIAKGVYIVDGACLPSLPAKHCTFTIMANAYRVGANLANSLVGNS